ncbi:metallophosphoesterase [Kangiella sediminilitoris]|uniref:Metallophosphoesterase n=1 Tax=Kangiella sediminilitoris TaxID=1144748 RepID=A0A1B3B974_9GAMM|nr:metallophosphoesterase [Kangiella sediminilitoris]AOE49343.1 Metallophosphoesterase [Kangiella sediminilitoris]
MNLNKALSYSSILVTFLVILTLPVAGIAKRTVAVTDVHGAYTELLNVLKASDVIDEKLRWSGKTDLLISIGDNLDRGPDSRKIMDLFIRLENEAKQSGGQVEVLLGNHEAMNLMSDLRYVSEEEYAAFIPDESERYRQAIYEDYLSYSELEDDEESRKAFLEMYPPGYFGLVAGFAPDGYYGRWLLQKNVLRTFNSRSYVHGGISKQVLDLELSEAGLNQLFRQELKDYATLYHDLLDAGLFKHYFNKLERKQVATALVEGKIQSRSLNKRSVVKKAKRFLEVADSLMLTTFGPIWYRGNIYCHCYSEQQTIDRALERFNSEQLLVGHTPDESRLVRSRFGNKLILLDTGMLRSHYNGHPSAIIIQDENLQVLNIDDPTNTTPLEDPVRKPLYADGYSDEYLKSFFENAKIVEQIPLDDFFSKPIKLTFSNADHQHSAIFKYYDSDPNMEKGSIDRRLANVADRYVYDMAAFKLDRILGLYMVPFTMEYTHNGQKGIIQYWVEDSISRTEMIEQNTKLYSFCSINESEDIMHIFDWLIFNEDRNTGNRLYSKDNGFLWLIDHTRSFRMSSKLPEYERQSPTYLSPVFREKLASLTRQQLMAELRAYLHPQQILSLLSRRDKILKYFQ